MISFSRKLSYIFTALRQEEFIDFGSKGFVFVICSEEPTGSTWKRSADISLDRLYPPAEPFGRLENMEDGINDRDMKTGSLVTAFVNACYRKTGVPIVGISAFRGGSFILEWKPLFV